MDLASASYKNRRKSPCEASISVFEITSSFWASPQVSLRQQDLALILADTRFSLEIGSTALTCLKGYLKDFVAPTCLAVQRLQVCLIRADSWLSDFGGCFRILVPTVNNTRECFHHGRLHPRREFGEAFFSPFYVDRYKLFCLL